MRTARFAQLAWTAAQLLCFLLALGSSVGVENSSWEVKAVLPEHPAPPESYLCMRVDLPNQPSLKLVGVEPLSNQELVHHMLLYGKRTCSPG